MDKMLTYYKKKLVIFLYKVKARYLGAQIAYRYGHHILKNDLYPLISPTHVTLFHQAFHCYKKNRKAFLLVCLMASFPGSSSAVVLACFFCVVVNIESIEGNGLCFNSIISFGDSFADTGTGLHVIRSSGLPANSAAPPYGETFFHRPTGRFSDGRLVIDFIAESLGLPLVVPYMGIKPDNKSKESMKKGVNFAVGGATALDSSYLLNNFGVKSINNASLGTQFAWFKQLLPSLCNSPLECKEFLKSSLIMVGEFGGNDINHGFVANITKEEIESYIPQVINTISSTIQEVIEMGGSTMVVPGVIPMGCSVLYLSKLKKSNKEQYYDPKTGCINWLNNFSEHYNKLLQKELHRLRKLYPFATIIYADYYNAAMQFYVSPSTHGFTGGALVACCGAGGPYNYNSKKKCGTPLATNICSDPSLYVSWDGLHFTEAAYKLIATGFLRGTYTFPPFNKFCITSLNPNLNHFEF